MTDYFSYTLDADAIREMNAEYRNKDAVTDVLSFPMYEFLNGEPQEELEAEPDSGCVMLGDMILCYTRACEGRNWSASGYDMRRRIRRRKIMRCLCACAAGRDFTTCRKFCCCIGIFPKIRRTGGGGKCTRPTNGLRRRYARRNGAAAK